MNYNNKQTSNPLNFGLSMIAGGGLVLMILAGGIGVVQGADTNTALVGILFAAGLLGLISGIIGWFAVVQPHRHFDDINVPLDTHGHGHEAHPAADDHAIVPHDAAGHRAAAVTVVEHDEHGHPISVSQH